MFARDLNKALHHLVPPMIVVVLLATVMIISPPETWVQSKTQFVNMWASFSDGISVLILTIVSIIHYRYN